MEPEVGRWFAERVPDGWFEGPLEVVVDREEVFVSGPIACGEGLAGVAVKRFREATRDERMRLADEAEHVFERKVSWGATCGGTTFVFTAVAVPVMTRLRMDERAVLDTLIDAGVARSRSEALAWCVRLVSTHQGDWIDALRNALVQVEEVRAAGPR